MMMETFRTSRPAILFWFKRLGLALLAPVLFLILLEGLLAITGLVEPVRLLKQVEQEGKMVWVTNPEYGRFVFRHTGAPMPSQIWVPVEREARKKRVVLIGESAAQGFPNSDFSLARILQVAWEQISPDQPVEVINLTMTGVNSHQLRLFLREALRLEPDQIVLYAGHNEYIGPYGPAAVLREYRSSTRLIRAIQFARSTRTGQLIVRMARAIAPLRSDAEIWKGLGGFMAGRLNPDDLRLEQTQRHFRSNLRSMLKRAADHEVPVLVALPAVNLTDWPPLASAPATIEDDDAAWQAWQEGRGSAFNSALQVYRLAASRAAAGDWDAAWPLFRLARDLDLYRFRADTAIHRILKEEADRAGATLVDTDRHVHEDNPSFTTDGAYFLEHVHLTFEGRVKVVEVILRSLASSWHLAPTSGLSINLDATALAERVLFTDQAAAEMWVKVGEFYQTPLFREQPGAAGRIDFTMQQAGLLSQWVVDPERRRVLTGHARRLLENHPQDALLHFTWGKHLVEYGQVDEAIQKLRTGLALFPIHHQAWLNLLALYTGQAQWAEAENALVQLQRWAPDAPDLPALAGRLYARQGRFEQALPWFERNLLRKPESASAHAQWSMCQYELGNREKAIAGLKRSLALDPTQLLNASNLAWFMLENGNPDPAAAREALRWATLAVEGAPTMHRFRGVLAVAHAAMGQPQAARAEAQRARTMALEQGDQQAADRVRSVLALYEVRIE